MKDGFEPEQAPATFRDAIKVARALGTRYLWIDSLCIIQNDREDWERESSRMGDIYEKAYLTIAASQATGDDEGFLMQRPPVAHSLRMISPDGDAANVHLRPQQNSYDSDDALQSRAWTLQERYLSRRKLRFLKNKILWECQCTSWDETEQDPLDLSGSEYHPEYTMGSLLDRSSDQDDHSYNSWYSLATDYSSRQLSRRSDKLPALSGLAGSVAAQTKFRYCAGIWWENIGYGICWEACGEEHDDSSPRRPDHYIAPSWSWTSVNRAVGFPDTGAALFFPGPKTLPSVVYLDCRVVPSGGDCFGEVESGWLWLKAPRASVRTAANEEQGSTLFTIGEAKARISLDRDCDTAEALWALFLMRATHAGEARRRWPNEVQLSGLVIRMVHNPLLEAYKIARLQTGQKSLYERVGFFSLQADIQTEHLFWQRPVEEILLV